ncbi:MAG: TlyA family RNA methyltransferase [Elusimicrobiota bacterium]|jgi:23S rRNA (cytidine1920-2'-O)/16S rRNA (cytidine1409-2'-O)-methyltransferase|nr:TlyA family RNA methyltransferase [Elusimicrobiota bacterium]
MKQRLDIFLVEKGLAPTRSRAQAFIIAGSVIVNGEVCYQSSDLIKQGDIVELRNLNPYVSRGGLKLQSVLDGLNIKVDGFVCLDIGASTGGFTDCLLQRGAARIYCIDVGYGQLHYKLRQDKRVVSFENVNFRYFDTSQLKDEIDFVVIDVSFISLDKILKGAYKAVKKNGFVLAMIKPQFELEAKSVKKGVVRDEVLRKKAIDKIKTISAELGFIILAEQDSGLKGPKGNLEHFIYLKK